MGFGPTGLFTPSRFQDEHNKPGSVISPWRERQNLNLHQLVLETSALPLDHVRMAESGVFKTHSFYRANPFPADAVALYGSLSKIGAHDWNRTSMVVLVPVRLST